MTEVRKMTDAALNRVLAKLMGYRITETSHGFYVVVQNGNIKSSMKWSEEMAQEEMPDFSADPAASLEVQAAAIAKEDEGYIKHLADIVGANCFWDGMYGDMAPTGIAWLLTATPRQRAEAAFLTLRGEGT